MAKMTMKNTKQEILDELDRVSKEAKEMAAVCSVPGEEAEKVRKEAVVEAAAEDVSNNIFSAEMNDKFTNLTEAIEIQEQKLTELYGVEKELMNLTTVINASKEKQVALKKENDEVRADLEKAKSETIESTRAAVNAAFAEADQAKKDLEAERKKEEAEYQYNLKWARKKEQDEYEEKKALRDKADAEREAAVEQREIAVLEREEEIAEMEATIAGIDSRLKESYEDGYAAGEKDAGREYGYKKAMAEKDAAHEKESLEKEIAYLKEAVEEKTDKIRLLEEKLNDAYCEIKDLAGRTVEASGGVKILNGNTPSGK